ncbi:MAG: hypothetical protein M1816_001566 [Peltula sp. TS41687]|nr:MAG: hypothetical protein M1816_001566 [Peltula sp. TS41687]
MKRNIRRVLYLDTEYGWNLLCEAALVDAEPYFDQTVLTAVLGTWIYDGYSPSAQDVPMGDEANLSGVDETYFTPLMMDAWFEEAEPKSFIGMEEDTTTRILIRNEDAENGPSDHLVGDESEKDLVLEKEDDIVETLCTPDNGEEVSSVFADIPDLSKTEHLIVITRYSRPLDPQRRFAADKYARKVLSDFEALIQPINVKSMRCEPFAFIHCSSREGIYMGMTQVGTNLKHHEVRLKAQMLKYLEKLRAGARVKFQKLDITYVWLHKCKYRNCQTPLASELFSIHVPHTTPAIEAYFKKGADRCFDHAVVHDDQPGSSIEADFGDIDGYNTGPNSNKEWHDGRAPPGRWFCAPPPWLFLPVFPRRRSPPP